MIFYTVSVLVVEIFSYARSAFATKYNLNCRTRAWCERSHVMTPLGVGMVNS